MTKDDQQTRRDKAQALLALAATREPAAVDDTPSDEELAQFLENSLDSTRRAQIQYTIAHNDDVFQRWSALVETANTLGVETFAGQPAKRQDSLIMRWMKDVREHLLGYGLTGGAITAALLAVLVLPGGGTGVDKLYDQYGQQWQRFPEPRLVVRGAGNTDTVSLSAPAAAVHDGIVEGLNQLGSRFYLDDFPMAVTASGALEPELARTLKTAGKIALLSHFKCTLGADSTYFDETLKTVTTTLHDTHDVTSLALKKSLGDSNDSRRQVCRFATTALRLSRT